MSIGPSASCGTVPNSAGESVAVVVGFGGARNVAGGEEGGVVLHGGQDKEIGVPCE